MPIEAITLFRPAGLEDVDRRSALSAHDPDPLQATAAWIESFLAKPHEDLGRAGPVCPFVPGALARDTLWLAREHVANRGLAEVLELVAAYQKQLLEAEPVDGDDAAYKSIALVFSDLPAERAKAFFDDVLNQLAVRSYVEDGLVMGGFYEGNAGSAVHNGDFHPFRSPVPFLLMRRAVVGDWKFFLDDPDWLDRWARRFGGAAVRALAEELRHLPWRTRRD